jgi:hypothetical protein
MESRSFQEIKSDLISLGLAYYGEPSPQPPDPEKLIIETICLFREDQKLYRMLLSWLDSYGDLVHVERLIHFLKDLNDEEKLFLGVTALKRVNAGDHRFKVLFERIKRQKPKLGANLAGQDEFLIEKHGIDSEFETFGIRTSTIDPSEKKKILQRTKVVENNLWLRLRALLGSNFRADVAFIKLSKLALNPYQTMKLVGCSKETTYRIWKSLEEAKIEELFKYSANPNDIAT